MRFESAEFSINDTDITKKIEAREARFGKVTEELKETQSSLKKKKLHRKVHDEHPGQKRFKSRGQGFSDKKLSHKRRKN